MMKQIVLVSFSLFLCLSLQLFAEDKLNVTVIVCEENDEIQYLAYQNVPPFIEQLGKENNWNVTVLKSEKYADFSGLEILDSTDVVVFYARRIGLPKEQMARLKKYVADSGKGLVAIRTACHGFAPNKLPANCAAWKEFDKKVLGGNYHGHGHNDIGAEIWNVKEQEKSPILKDVQPAVWHSVGSVYFNDPVAEDATVYQYAASSEKGRMPLTWTRMYGKTRVAFTALGHKTDFNVPAYKYLIRNLVEWAGAKE
jgi:type 1 glutamine amidotransferase